MMMHFRLWPRWVGSWVGMCLTVTGVNMILGLPLGARLAVLYVGVFSYVAGHLSVRPQHPHTERT